MFAAVLLQFISFSSSASAHFIQLFFSAPSSAHLLQLSLFSSIPHIGDFGSYLSLHPWLRFHKSKSLGCYPSLLPWLLFRKSKFSAATLCSFHGSYSADPEFRLLAFATCMMAPLPRIRTFRQLSFTTSKGSYSGNHFCSYPSLLSWLQFRKSIISATILRYSHGSHSINPTFRQLSFATSMA